jgi:membrane associated rhomboid family serine protease
MLSLVSEDLVVVFNGSHAACAEYALVLEAQAIPYQLLANGTEWALLTEPATAVQARGELTRYAQEARVERPPSVALPAFPGAGFGAVGYAFVLLVVAQAAGAHWFARDWFAAGAVDASPAARDQWWRALTALTLHLGPEHLFGNLLFGIVAGALCSRLVGPGVAWLTVLLAGGAANGLEALIAPVDHRAVGASTAVFAALGLLTGLAWRQRLTLRGRWLYRFAPLIAGVCLLALLGSGTAQVDVLGHLLGFVIGVVLGWAYVERQVPRSRSVRVQFAAGALAVALILGAWCLALWQ